MLMIHLCFWIILIKYFIGYIILIIIDNEEYLLFRLSILCEHWFSVNVSCHRRRGWHSLCVESDQWRCLFQMYRYVSTNQITIFHHSTNQEVFWIDEWSFSHMNDDRSVIGNPTKKSYWDIWSVGLFPPVVKKFSMSKWIETTLLDCFNVWTLSLYWKNKSRKYWKKYNKIYLNIKLLSRASNF